MTNAERAEKIANEIYKCSHVMSCQNIEDLITSQLDKAVQEAELNILHTSRDYHRCEEDLKRAKAISMADNTCPEIYTEKIKKEARNEGFAIAREQAAGIAESCWNSHKVNEPCHGYGIRDSIRAMETEK